MTSVITTFVSLLFLLAIGLVISLAAQGFLYGRQMIQFLKFAAITVGVVVFFYAEFTWMRSGRVRAQAGARAKPSLDRTPQTADATPVAGPHRDPFPWATFGWAVAAAVLLLLLMMVAVFLVRRLRKSRQVVAGDQCLLTALTARHDQVMLEYGEYETDLVEVFSRPALTDVSVPQTAAFLAAWGAADDRRPAAGSRPPQPVFARYEEAVRTLEAKWGLANRYATRVGLRNMPPAEQRTVRRAVGLLRQALDPGQPDEARQAFYDHALRLVRDIVTVPERAIAAIEAAHWLAITPTAVDPTDPTVRSDPTVRPDPADLTAGRTRRSVPIC